MHNNHMLALCSAVLILLTGCAGAVPNPEPADETAVSTSGTTVTTVTTTELTTTTTTTNVYTPPQSHKLENRVGAMTLREKAAQMILVGCSDVDSAEHAAENGAGALCLFAAPFDGKTKEQVQEMTLGFQALAHTPLIISVDEEGGPVNRISVNPLLRERIFYSPRYLFTNGGWDALESENIEKAILLRSLGVNVNLAPVCDVPLSENDYIYTRCFSLDAQETADYITWLINLTQQYQLGSVLKHFPGYGGSGDTHKNMAYDSRDYSAFENGDFLPFEAGIAAGAQAVMVSHNIVQCMDADYPASLSQEVHRILREELKFRGVIISDDLGMNAITQFTNGQNPAVAAVLAGNDLICYADFDQSVDAITEAVQNGVIPESQINASVLRILAWKESLGLI